MSAENSVAAVNTVCVRFKRDGMTTHRGEPTSFWNSHDVSPSLAVGQFHPAPLLSVELPPNNLTMSSEPAVIDLPTDTALLIEDMSNLRPCGLIEVDIWELVFDFDQNINLTHYFSGLVSRAIRNYGERKGFTRIEALWHWAYWDKTPAFTIDQSCPWVFAAPHTCGRVITEDMKAKAVVSSIKNKDLTLSNYSLVNKVHDLQFRNGSVIVDGMALTIRDWHAADPTRLVLMEQPPKWWIGKNASLFPGCDFSRERCGQWNNLNRWGGSGILMPDVNPTYESIDV